MLPFELLPHPRRSRLCTVILLSAATVVPLAAQSGNHSWTDYGGGPDNTHYVPLTQITKDNVSQLKQVWEYPTHDNQGYVFNPIVIRNTMYVLARNNSLVALDATTGKELWVHSDLSGISSRGINYWESKDGKDKRLVFQIHHQLQEIDAETGKPILAFGDNGFVDLRVGLGRPLEQIYRIQSNNPGKIFENLLILGSVTGENFMSPPGDLRAYDVRTGNLVWQFHTIPHPGEPGYKTWPKDAWKYLGGVNTWGEITVDEKRGIAYFPLGSPTYDFYGADRAGNGLYGDCLLALNARTGKLLWSYQVVHHDLWDYDNTSAPQLATVRHNGKNIDVVAQAGKTGFLYVFDRVTGKPLWPIEERPVPKSEMPGEHASPTQPFPTAPPPFGRQKFTAEDINPYILTDEERAALKIRVDSARNEGIYTPPGFKDSIEMPGNRGGSNWGTTGADPVKGMVFVADLDAPAILKMQETDPTARGGAGRAGRGGANNPGLQVYTQNCAACHNADRTGGVGPSLVGIADRVGVDVIRNTIQNGSGQMPGLGSLSDAEVNAVIGYLANPAGGPGRGRGGALPIQDPLDGARIVASGGAPAAKDAPGAKLSGPGPFGAMAGLPYPAGIEAPSERYYTGWNVMYNIVSPPWSSLVAYDLNQGTIKWKVPLGEDPAAAALGVHNTGIRQEQRGILTTATGLVFVATSDGKLRCFDEETGKEIWTADMPGGNRAVPAMYEVNGRQFLVVSATTRVGATGPPGAPQPPEPPDATPRGYVVYALPEGTE